MVVFGALWGPFRNRRWAKNVPKNYLRALFGAGTSIFEAKSALREGVGKSKKNMRKLIDLVWFWGCRNVLEFLIPVRTGT